jgi:hypothetical protein
MANTTRWVIDTNWTTLVNGSDLTAGGTAGLPSTDTVLSTVSITNGTGLDMYMDISQSLAIASSTIAAGACMTYYLCALLQDGTSFGDGLLIAGTAAVHQLAFPPLCSINAFVGAAQTAINGFYQGIVLPPGTFSIAVQNNLGFALTSTSANQLIYYRTYNINLNV